jgi:ribonuclease P protein component
MERLKRRTDFRAVAAGNRATRRGFALQAWRRTGAGVVRVGFTVSRRVGNAVERNRVRRRLREMVRLAAAAPTVKLLAGYDYVLVGRRAALELPFGEMMQELDAALGRIHARKPETTGGVARPALHEAHSPGSPLAPPRQNWPSHEH